MKRRSFFGAAAAAVGAAMWPGRGKADVPAVIHYRQFRVGDHAIRGPGGDVLDVVAVTSDGKIDCRGEGCAWVGKKFVPFVYHLRLALTHVCRVTPLPPGGPRIGDLVVRKGGGWVMCVRKVGSATVLCESRFAHGTRKHTAVLPFTAFYLCEPGIESIVF